MQRKPARPTLLQLRALTAIALHGSYSAAALETDSSQSTLSHAIQDLERNLGATLLERGRMGAKLTALGQRVVEHARDAITSLEALEQEVMLETSGLTGTIRMMSYRSLATHLLPGAVQVFQKQHPNVSLEFMSEAPEFGGIEEYVRDGRADLGLLELPNIGGDLLEFELARDQYVLLSSSAQPAPTTWGEIQAQPFIHDGGICSKALRTHWSANGLTLVGAYTVQSDSAILGMVAQGLGISVMPSLAAQPVLAGVRVSAIPAPLERRLGIVVTRRKLRVPAIRAFVDTVRGYAASHPLEEIGALV